MRFLFSRIFLPLMLICSSFYASSLMSSTVDYAPSLTVSPAEAAGGCSIRGDCPPKGSRGGGSTGGGGGSTGGGGGSTGGGGGSTGGGDTTSGGGMVLYSCHFEPNGQNCLSTKGKNEIKTFAQLGIPALKGGGQYAVSAKTTAKINSEDLRWYRNKHKTQDLYVRLYVFFPNGYHAAPNFNSLKFLSVGTQDRCSNCIWTKVNWKLAEQSGQLIIGPNAGQPGSSKAEAIRIPSPVTRGQWHYLEMHQKNSPSGPDLVEAWLDRDSRTSAPNMRFEKNDIFPAATGHFTQVGNNFNWSGFNPPWVQEFYVDGLKAATGPIGDEYGLSN